VTAQRVEPDAASAEQPGPPAIDPNPLRHGLFRHKRLGALLAVLMVIGAGLALRLYRLEDESLWVDEAVSVLHLDEPGLWRFLQAERRDDPPMFPIYFAVEYGWARLFGDSVATLRLLGIVLWAVGALCLYRLGRELFGFLAGFTALALYSFSMLHVYYSQEIRMYALVVPLAAASVLTLILGVKRGGAWWHLHLLINGLLLWTHMFAGFLMAAEGLWLLSAYPRRWKHWIAWGAAHAPFVAGAVVWMLKIDFTALDKAAAWIPMPAWHFLPLSLCWPTSWMPETIPFLRIGLATLAVSLAVVFGMAAVRRDRDTAAKGLLLVLWLVVPAVCALLVSYLHSPITVPRYILYASLAFYLLLGGDLSLVPSRGLRALALLALIALVAAQVPQARPQRPRWNEAAAIVARGAAEGDIVVVSPAYKAATLSCYAPVPRDRIFGIYDAAAPTERTFAQGGRVWFVGNATEVNGRSHPGEIIDLRGAALEQNRSVRGSGMLYVLRYSRPRLPQGALTDNTKLL